MSYLVSATVLAALGAACWRDKQGGAVARGIFLLALAATGLRLLAGNVGVWAEGALDVGVTILIAFVLPVWLCLFFPTWFAWRVLHPLGLHGCVVAGFWFSPWVRRCEISTIRIFLGVLRKLPFPPAAGVTADAWTALAAAVQADEQKAYARLDAIVEALTHVPSGTRFPGLARQVGVEALARRSATRRDWPAVLRITRLGSGRTVRLLDILARAEVGLPVLPGRLWLAWLLSPMRLSTYGHVRALTLAAKKQESVTPPPRGPNPQQTRVEARSVSDPHLRHVRLLGAAARGQTIAMQEILSLAHAWQEALDGASLARLHARALELDVRNGAGAHLAQAMKVTVLRELTDLACVAVGAMDPQPLSQHASDSLVVDLFRSVENQLYREVNKALAPIDSEKTKTAVHPLVAWEQWLAVREAVERFEQRAGQDALKVLWYSLIRDRVWRWAYAEWTERGEQSGWAMAMVFDWMADQAEVLGDLPATAINRENARVARLAA